MYSKGTAIVTVNTGHLAWQGYGHSGGEFVVGIGSLVLLCILHISLNLFQRLAQLIHVLLHVLIGNCSHQTSQITFFLAACCFQLETFCQFYRQEKLSKTIPGSYQMREKRGYCAVEK